MVPRPPARPSCPLSSRARARPAALLRRPALTPSGGGDSLLRRTYGPRAVCARAAPPRQRRCCGPAKASGAPRTRPQSAVEPSDRWSNPWGPWRPVLTGAPTGRRLVWRGSCRGCRGRGCAHAHARRVPRRGPPGVCARRSCRRGQRGCAGGEVMAGRAWGRGQEAAGGGRHRILAGTHLPHPLLSRGVERGRAVVGDGRGNYP